MIFLQNFFLPPKGIALNFFNKVQHNIKIYRVRVYLNAQMLLYIYKCKRIYPHI